MITAELIRRKRFSRYRHFVRHHFPRYCQVNFQGFIKSQTNLILSHTTDSTWVISCQSFRRLSTKTLKVFAETKCRSNLKQS